MNLINNELTRKARFGYLSMASLKAHCQLDEFIHNNRNINAAREIYYYIELCWFASSLNFKIQPKKLQSGRILIADYINNNEETVKNNTRNKTMVTLFECLTCADSVASRVGKEKMNEAFNALAKKIRSYQTTP